jgi:RNA recognition motif-containing protein
MRDRVTGKPRGFGFITFIADDAAKLACSDTHTLDGRTVGAAHVSAPGPQWGPAHGGAALL